MKNSSYWQKRFSLLEESRHKAGAEVYKEIENQYKRAQKEIETEIDKWYRRFAKINNVSMAEARKWLKGKDLKEFKWSVQEYIRHGEENAISGEWMKEMENASAKFHISRLEALKINTRHSIEALYGQQQSLVSEFLGETYKSDYYHTAYELQKGFEIGFDIGKVNEDYLQKVLFKPWASDGSNFSDRIWTNKDKLINEIHKELTQNIMRGQDPQKAIDAIAHKMGVSKANAGRLVMTEEAYFSSLAQKDCFGDLGVDEFEIVATLDSKTSEICQEMDGQHFPMKDFEAGVSAPPFHVSCRSTTCPYFPPDDEFSLGERAARGENGEVYYVPSDMTYPEWKEKYVKDNEENVEKPANKGYNYSRDYEQYERYKNVIETSYMPDTFEEFKRIKYEDKAAYGKLKHSYRILNAYEDNSGHMDRKKLIELDQFAYDTKTKDFTGNAKRKANIAVMEMDGKIKIGNSQLNELTDSAYINFKGDKELLVLMTDKPKFKTIEVGSHIRDMDSEAKLLEYAAKIADDGNVHTLNLLSEKCMCESCRGVLEQFKEQYPNVEINVVSNKAERSVRNHNKPWGHRYS